MAYATESDYLAWTGEDTAPSDINARLEQASLDVEMAILVAFDDSDPDTAEALKRATVIHAAREFDPTISDTSELEAMSLGPLSLTYGKGRNERTAAARLVPLARDVLFRAGLLYRGLSTGSGGVILP